MTFAASLIPGLDEFVKYGDPKRRAEAARRIAELFLLGAANFRPDHVDWFDGVLIALQLLVERALDKSDLRLLRPMTKRVGVALRGQRENRVVRCDQGPGQYMLWEIADNFGVRILLRYSFCSQKRFPAC
jgi:hypothetical protein